MIISDNASTFEATEKWLKTLRGDDRLDNYLGQQTIKWRFNLARAPWWGGFFERMVGIMKRSLNKQIGKALLTYDELRDTLLDVENFINNRPLTYIGEELERPVLSPNILLKGNSTPFLEEDLEKIGYMEEDKLVTKRLVYLQRTKRLLKKRWQTEYLHALRDQRNKVRPQEVPVPGSVVLITDHLSGNGFKPQWSLGKVLSQIRGRDGVVRGLRLKNSKGYEIERPLELIRPLEIQCAESTTLDDVATASADGSTSTAKEDGVKSRYTRAKHYRDDFIQHEEDSTTSQRMQHKAQRGTQRRAAASARIANQLLQEHEML